MSDITFSAYDERMRPMFVKLAERVRENGQESEYETLAEIIGAPDLDDLIGPAERIARFRVPLMVTRREEVIVYVDIDGYTGPDSREGTEAKWIAEHRNLIDDALESEGIDAEDIEPSGSEYIEFEEYVD